MHIFDIQRSSNALAAWRAIHMKSCLDSGLQRVGSKNEDRRVAVTEAGSSVDLDKALSSSNEVAPTVGNDDLHDARRRWVRHCNPPVLHAASDTNKIEGSAAPETVSSSSEDWKCGSGQRYMTAEGRKMVCPMLRYPLRVLFKLTQLLRQMPPVLTCVTHGIYCRAAKRHPSPCPPPPKISGALRVGLREPMISTPNPTLDQKQEARILQKKNSRSHYCPRLRLSWLSS